MTDEEQFAEWMRRRYSDGSTDRDMVAYGAARAPLLEENERLRKDAERYRWIRNKTDEPDEAYYYLPSVWRWYSPGPGKLNEQHQTLDAAIDAALEGK
jgi:siroheme synthase (precorrin-2 oxidase/ferrochelatase)